PRPCSCCWACGSSTSRSAWTARWASARSGWAWRCTPAKACGIRAAARVREPGPAQKPARVGDNRGMTTIHILGIAGTFMGGVAALARELGYDAEGSDQAAYPPMSTQLRSEEHTSELQSRENLVCRLLR